MRNFKKNEILTVLTPLKTHPLDCFSLLAYPMITKHVLFLCTGNYYRSRFAEEYFNYLAKINSLNWRADSRGLAANITELRNPGPVSQHALSELKKRTIVPENAHRFPQKASYADFEKSEFIIALGADPVLRKIKVEKGFPSSYIKFTQNNNL